MSHIKAVLWDMDGVLVDSERLVQKAFAEVMARNKIMENPAERFLETIGMNRQTMMKWVAKYIDSQEVAEALYDEVGALYRARMADELTLKPGVVTALQSVKAQGLPQMVVTSSKHEIALHKLEMFDVHSYFDGVLGGDQVVNGKPHPEPYLTGASRLGVSPEQALVIEDSSNGVKSGLAAGAMVMHVPDLIPTDPEWDTKIYAALDSLTSFPKWLEEQNGVHWV